MEINYKIQFYIIRFLNNIKLSILYNIKMEPYVVIEKHFVPIQMYREMMHLPAVPNVMNSTQLYNNSFSNLMNYSPVDFSYFVRDTPPTTLNRPIIPQTLSRPEVVEHVTSNISITNLNNNQTSNTNARITNNILDTIINSISSVLPNGNREANIQGVIISNVPLERDNRRQRVFFNRDDEEDHGFNPNVINQYTNFYKYEDFTQLDIFDSHNTNFTICAICQNNLENNEIIRQLKNCKHVFHLTCIDTWLTNRSTCPTCRQPLINHNHHSDNEDEEDEEDDEEDEDYNEDDEDNQEDEEDNNDNDEQEHVTSDEEVNNQTENIQNNNIPQPSTRSLNDEIFGNIMNLAQQYLNNSNTTTVNRDISHNLTNALNQFLSNSNTNIVNREVNNVITQLFPSAFPLISSVDTIVNRITRNN